MAQGELYNRKEAAWYLGLSVVTVDRALKAKTISCYRIGDRVIFGRQHLDEFLQQHEHPREKAPTDK